MCQRLFARRIAACVAFVIPSVVSSLAQAAPQYTINSFAVPNVSGVQFTDINDQAVAVGFTGSNPSAAFMSNGMTSTILNPLASGKAAYAHGINNSGVIVGEALNAGGNFRAVSFGSGTNPTTDILSTAPISAQPGAYAINNSGQFTGLYGDHAFLYSGGVVTDLGTLPGLAISQGLAINTAGQIAGQASNGFPSSADRGFIWSNGVMTDLGLPAGETSAAVAFVEALNDSGWVTGSWQRYVGGTSQNRHAFVWQGGVMTDITPGFVTTGFADAFDINNLGQIVGAGKKTQGPTNDSIGFLWDNGTAYDLDTLVLDPNSNWIIDAAYAINNLGQILVGGRYDGQNTYALLTPVATPIPAAVWLFGSGLVGLFALGRRRKH